MNIHLRKFSKLRNSWRKEIIIVSLRQILITKGYDSQDTVLPFSACDYDDKRYGTGVGCQTIPLHPPAVYQ